MTIGQDYPIGKLNTRRTFIDRYWAKHPLLGRKITHMVHSRNSQPKKRDHISIITRPDCLSPVETEQVVVDPEGSTLREEVPDLSELNGVLLVIDLYNKRKDDT